MSSDSDTTIAQLRSEVAAFIRERDWEQFHDPKNLSMAIATEAAELMEHFRWVRSEGAAALLDDPVRRQAIAEEVADVMAFLLSFANATGIDITSCMREKMLRNARKYPADEYKGRY